MALKDIWIDRVDGVDDASAEDINNVAHAVIENEDVLSETTKIVVQNEGKIKNIYSDYPLFSNAIKGSASGEIVSLDDVSPIAHEMAVSVTGVADTSSVNIKVLGKNLCNVASVTSAENVAGSFYLYDIKKHGTYTASADVTLYVDDTATYPNFTLQAWYTDNTYTVGQYSQAIIKDGVAKRVYATVTTDNTKEIKSIRIIALNYSQQNGRHAKAENIQLECAATASAYEPYKEPVTYAQGEPITSIYPCTTLMTDTAGAFMNVTYNRDANKVVNELETRIAALEDAILN